jgi:hypothetical protein
MSQILDRKPDSVPAMMPDKLKMKEDIAQIMKMPTAAVEFVNLAKLKST